MKESLRRWYSRHARDWNQRFAEYIQLPTKRIRFDTFSAKKKNAFYDMIKSMLVFEPSKRATIEDVGSKWMQRWGLPEVQRKWDAIPQSSGGAAT